MPIQHTELRGSREGTDSLNRGSTGVRRWAVIGTDNPLEARDYLDSNNIVPAFFDGLVYRSLERADIGPEHWEFTANYIEAERADFEHKLTVSGEYTFSFEVGGQNVTRTQSLATKKWGTGVDATSGLPDGSGAPDHGGAINVQGREVKGVDVLTPTLKFSIRKKQPKASITLEYINTLYELVGKTNNALFLGQFVRGEILFAGASGQQGTEADPEITYNFTGSPNTGDDGLTLGTITGIDKKGHEFLWSQHETAEDADTNTTSQALLAVYVEQVYEEANFANLLI